MSIGPNYYKKKEKEVLTGFEPVRVFVNLTKCDKLLGIWRVTEIEWYIKSNKYKMLV